MSENEWWETQVELRDVSSVGVKDDLPQHNKSLHPTPDFWCRNQFGVLVQEIETLHRALWDRDDRMELEVRGFDKTFGAHPSTVGFEFSITA